ncbi:AtpZ/AtpI family protein [Alteromonas facilis]|uniref:AtpZ/AtpI family protein n=1 Tax=Alteromonas facilis TaxID=2048004 RepID=UPI000C289BCB|nr:AtpZ/AtpI family protein [Alteromonas facilis]
MNDHKRQETTDADTSLANSSFAKIVDKKAARKQKARRSGSQRVWFGLGMIGLIGWSITIPTLLGATLGIYLDRQYPDQRSWTLALLMAGLTMGCLNAWHWIVKEDLAIRDEQKEDESAVNKNTEVHKSEPNR